MAKKLILSSGLSGLIGSRMNELLDKKYSWQGVSLENGQDITNRDTVDNLISNFNGEVVTHLAAFTNVDAAWKENNNKNGACYQINVIGTQNIAKACKKYNKFLIHVSTEYVFDGKKKEPYTEEDKPNPVDWYAKTKFLAEERVKNSGCSFAILRTSFPFRAFFDQKLDVVRKIINGFETKDLKPMFTDMIITPTFIDDFVCAVDVIIEKRPEGIFHAVGSSSLSPYALACKIADIFNFNKTLIRKNRLIKHVAGRPYPPFLAISNKKTSKLLGIHMKNIDEALLAIKNQLLLGR